MTFSGLFKDIAEGLGYTGQSILYIQNVGFCGHFERLDPFQLWNDDLLIKVVKYDLFATAIICGVFSLLMGTFPLGMLVLLVAPTLALLGLGFSYLAQKLEPNCENMTPALII